MGGTLAWVAFQSTSHLSLASCLSLQLEYSSGILMPCIFRLGPAPSLCAARRRPVQPAPARGPPHGAQAQPGQGGGQPGGAAVLRRCRRKGAAGTAYAPARSGGDPRGLPGGHQDVGGTSSACCLVTNAARNTQDELLWAAVAWVCDGILPLNIAFRHRLKRGRRQKTLTKRREFRNFRSCTAGGSGRSDRTIQKVRVMIDSFHLAFTGVRGHGPRSSSNQRRRGRCVPHLPGRLVRPRPRGGRCGLPGLQVSPLPVTQCIVCMGSWEEGV